LLGNIRCRQKQISGIVVQAEGSQQCGSRMSCRLGFTEMLIHFGPADKTFLTRIAGFLPPGPQFH
jgi:hypothetical protein